MLQGVRLGERLGTRDNNFDLLRLLAAWSVLVSHSYFLTGNAEPLHQFRTTLGAVGVLIFFAVSGLLIRRSWEYDPSPRDFWIKRALRLLPALVVVGLATAFVLGPAVTTKSLSAYASSPETWIYPLRVALLMPFGAGLPGVFRDLVGDGSLNGPLWSLPVEVFAYLVLFVLGFVGLLAKRGAALVIAGLALAWASVWSVTTPPMLAQMSVLAAFAVGAACYSYADRLVLSWPIALGVLVVAVLAGLGPIPLRVVVWSVAACYLSYWFAYALPPVGRFVTRLGDASYGLYIWAYPIQLLLVSRFDLSPWQLIGLATPIVWLLAMTSWRLIERPALRRKPKPASAPHPTSQ